MNKKNLLASVLMLAAGVSLCSAAAPDILIPAYPGAGVIHGLSNNGKYGVASVNPEATAFSYTVGAVIYDLTGSTPVPTDLTQGHSTAAANDVTDDGALVVGMIDNLPAICRNVGGTWTWETLPVPKQTYTLVPETSDNDEVFTFELNAGEVSAVTPDGRYAVGVARSLEYELLEKGVMWDLSTMKIVEVASPVTGNDGRDYYQSRYNQISDDGRYILCWNAFSYIGSLVFVFDRVEGQPVYIDMIQNGSRLEPRLEGYRGLNLDGITKSLTSDGRYVAGGITSTDEEKSYVFLFDVFNKELKVFDQLDNDDVIGWSVTRDGIPLAASPAVTPYADGFICYNSFLFPVEQILTSYYGINLGAKGIENTGKPTLVSDDGRTLVFVTEPSVSYVLRLKEDLGDICDNLNLMSSWSVAPADGTKMTVFTGATISFVNEIEADASRYADVKLLDSAGKTVATALAQGGVQTDGSHLVLNFRARQLDPDENYTLSIPADICWIHGRSQNKNAAIEVKYTGRANVPVAVSVVSPSEGSALANLDLNENPVVVSFDAPVMINADAEHRPIAHLYVEGSEEPAASLAIDVDVNTHKLVIYPAATVYLYKGAQYTIEVPAGAVCDLSGYGPSEAFSISYTGAFVPQLGDEKYIFRTTADDFTNMMVYEGDKGTPTDDYAAFGFTAQTTPWWVVYDDEDSNGAFASHSVYTDGRRSDDWLVIRQLSIPKDVPAYLSFRSQSYRKSRADSLKVFIYEENASINNLSADRIADIRANGDLVFNERIFPGASEEKLAGEWTDYVISLDPYAGKNIYICFLNDNQNQSMVMIDDIEVVKELKAFITLTSPTIVVDCASAPVKGIITIESELVDYSSLSMKLLDASGNEVSGLSASGLNLKGGDMYNFEFPDALPVVVGEENPFSIAFTLDDDEMDFKGVVRDLAFQPRKRVIVEEYTGRDCVYCPLGIIGMLNLERLFGDQVIPVVLHAYGDGSDPKGIGILDYAASVFMGNSAAPNGRINRRPYLNSPMAVDADERYQFSLPGMNLENALWQDVVADELKEPAFLDISLEPNEIGVSNKISYTAKVKSALNLKDQNIRVLGILLEDGLADRQQSAIYNISDPNLGEFGEGGKFGSRYFSYTFNDVAKGYWGQSTNGTGHLIPSELSIGEEYEVNIEYDLPGIIDNPANVKMAVILIDENTGRVINANVRQSINGVDEIIDDGDSSLRIVREGSEVQIVGSGQIVVEAYGLDGRKLLSATGANRISIPVDSLHGMVILHATSASATAVEKILF